jgi:RecJ-like exonuclease
MSAKDIDYQCGRCGSSISFHECPECGGEGVTSHDCGEDCGSCAGGVGETSEENIALWNKNIALWNNRPIEDMLRAELSRMTEMRDNLIKEARMAETKIVEVQRACDACKGDGTFARCLSSPEWCQAHPLPGRETTERSTVESFSTN